MLSALLILSAVDAKDAQTITAYPAATGLMDVIADTVFEETCFLFWCDSFSIMSHMRQINSTTIVIPRKMV